MAADTLEDYVKRLIPPSFDATTVARRKEEIVAGLQKGGITVVSSFEAGSFSHGTAIAGKADVDLMAWVTYSEQTALPSSMLEKFRSSLYIYTSATSAKVSSPTVQLSFPTPPRLEVVPAFYEKEVASGLLYEIPGRGNEWVVSAPKVHKQFVNTQNDRLAKKVKPLVRLVKAWRYHVQAPISSFYLEMRTAEYAKGEKSIYYYIDLPSVLRRILGKGLADMNDPSGVAGRIPACSSEANRAASKRLMTDAMSNLERAEAARNAGNRSDYWSFMSRVFGTEFPYPTWGA